MKIRIEDNAENREAWQALKDCGPKPSLPSESESVAAKNKSLERIAAHGWDSEVTVPHKWSGCPRYTYAECPACKKFHRYQLSNTNQRFVKPHPQVNYPQRGDVK